MDTPSHASVRIGLWGTFDVESYGDVLFPWVARAELRRRLPAAEIRTFAPLGSEHPNRFDGGEPSEPLGTHEPRRLAELAEALDCVIVGGGHTIAARDEVLAAHYGISPEEMARRAPSRFFIEGLGPELEGDCPVLWHSVGIPADIEPEDAPRFRQAVADRPYVTVGDDISRRRLVAAGVDREVSVVPDPALLVPRTFPPDVLGKRLEYLRVTGRFPPQGPALVVQGDRSLIANVPDLAAAVEAIRRDRQDLPVVVAETASIHGDHEFATVLASAVAPPVYRLGPVGVHDVVSAIGASEGFIGVSLHGNITAFAYGRPHLMLGMRGESRLRGFADLIENPDCLVRHPEDLPAAFEKAEATAARSGILPDLQAGIDEHFERIVEVAVDAASRRQQLRAASAAPEGSGVDELRRRVSVLARAVQVRGRLLAEQRWRFADRVQEAEAEERRTRDRLRSEIRRLEREQAELRREVAGKDRELRTLLNTRTFRYTARLRQLWGTMRSVGRR